MLDLPFYSLDDNEFQLAFSELSESSYFDRNRLNKLGFSSFLLNDTVIDNGDFLDPDQQFYTTYTNYECSYLLEDDFNSKYQKFTGNTFFSLIHFNARIVYPKILK